MQTRYKKEIVLRVVRGLHRLEKRSQQSKTFHISLLKMHPVTVNEIPSLKGSVEMNAVHFDTLSALRHILPEGKSSSTPTHVPS